VGRIGTYGPAHFRGTVLVVIRDLTDDAVSRALRAVEQLPRDGLPNYSDDQRFGSSVSPAPSWPVAWLRRARAGPENSRSRPQPDGPAADETEKTILCESWGRGPRQIAVERSHARSLVTYLVYHPTTTAGRSPGQAGAPIGIFSAFQSTSDLMLAKVIEWSPGPTGVPIEFKAATLPIPRNLDPDQAPHSQPAGSRSPRRVLPAAGGPGREVALEVVGAQDWPGKTFGSSI